MPEWIRASVAAIAIAALAPSPVLAEEIPLAEAVVLAELNDTDGDLGFHALIDGEGWKRLKIVDPSKRVILDVMNKGRLAKQGLTELFFESAEPGFDELTAEEFFERFPEGEYEIEAVGIEGDTLEGEALFTHVMPAPANITSPVSDCETPIELGAGVDLVIAWDAVTTSHPTIGTSDPGIVITGYEVTVEREEPEPVLVYRVDLPADATTLTVPAAFMALGTAFKFAVLSREASGNQTSVESCVDVAED
ncbi:MAG: hypothetical protein R3229_00635 [Alphaproteobacteria bacterium]|nr:hypothetical protein [Alphaproteobacteria bacterium]